MSDELVYTETITVRFEGGEYEDLESLLRESRAHYQMLAREAKSITKGPYKNREHEYTNLAATFTDALMLLKAGRHVRPV